MRHTLLLGSILMLLITACGGRSKILGAQDTTSLPPGQLPPPGLPYQQLPPGLNPFLPSPTPVATPLPPAQVPNVEDFWWESDDINENDVGDWWTQAPANNYFQQVPYDNYFRGGITYQVCPVIQQLGPNYSGYVTALYLDILRRPPSQQELQSGIQQLGAGTSRYNFAYTLLMTADSARAHIMELSQGVTNLGFYGQVDPAAVIAFQSGGVEGFFVYMLSTENYYRNQARNDCRTYIDMVYQYLLARNSTRSEMDAWKYKVNRGVVDRQSFIQMIVSSGEFKNRFGNLYASRYVGGGNTNVNVCSILASGCGYSGTILQQEANLFASDAYFQKHAGSQVSSTQSQIQQTCRY